MVNFCPFLSILWRYEDFFYNNINWQSLVYKSIYWNNSSWKDVQCISKPVYPHIQATLWENLFMPFANNEGADQPAHSCGLISAFVFSLTRKYSICTCYIQNIKTLASCCSWTGWFESYLVRNLQWQVFSFISWYIYFGSANKKGNRDFWFSWVLRNQIVKNSPGLPCYRLKTAQTLLPHREKPCLWVSDQVELKLAC